MNPIRWLRWRLRVPRVSDDRVVQLGQLVAWKETPSLHKWAAELEAVGMSVGDPLSRYRLWLAELAAWEMARRSRTVSPDVLDRFFGSFWGVVAQEMAADLLGRIVLDSTKLREDLNALVQELEKPAMSAEWHHLSATLGEGAVSWAQANVLSGFLRRDAPAQEASELTMLGLHFGYKLVACADLLDGAGHLDAT